MVTATTWYPNKTHDELVPLQATSIGVTYVTYASKQAVQMMNKW